MYSVFYIDCQQCGERSASFQGTSNADQAKQLEYISRQHESHDYTVTVEELSGPDLQVYDAAFDG